MPLHVCRAHYLLGVYSVEDLDSLVGSSLPTLNPAIQWEVRKINGVRTFSPEEQVQLQSVSLQLSSLVSTSRCLHTFGVDSRFSSHVQ